jgi:TetR/AcrR family transcriptional repressor of nem operon
MPRDGSITRDKILVAAQELILEQGYGGMSLDGVIERAGITKGAFFYHFANKQALARALVERFARMDREHYEATIERAENLTRDPVQQLLVVAGLLIEELAASDLSGSGCLYAAFCYQNGLIEDDTLQVARVALGYWREHFGRRVEAALDQRPPLIPVSAQDLVDQLLVSFEGGFVMARSLNEGDQVAKALRHYRNYLELLFALEAAPEPVRP